MNKIFAQIFSLNIFEEERVLPLILLQRISRVMAEELFNILKKISLKNF